MSPAPLPAEPSQTRDPRGLCPSCAHVHVIRNDRGSTFFRCLLAKQDPSWSKYPPQPVLRCSGHEPAPADPKSP